MKKVIENNLMSLIYLGYIVEIIYSNGIPTFELRVRVPSIHGINSKVGISDSDLPIAKPLIIPGTILDVERFEEFISSVKLVYVIFEQGDLSRPVYLGLRNNATTYDLSSIASLDDRIIDLVEEHTHDGIYITVSEDEPAISKAGDLWFKIIP